MPVMRCGPDYVILRDDQAIQRFMMYCWEIKLNKAAKR